MGYVWLHMEVESEQSATHKRLNKLAAVVATWLILGHGESLGHWSWIVVR